MIVRPVLCRSFVGRKEELAYLRQRRLEAASSHGGLIFIAGEAGLGKSRLIAEFCRSLAGSRWRVADGQSLEHTRRPYGPFIQAFGDLEAEGGDLVAARSKAEQLDRIVSRIGSLAARKALIVVIEDLHWADAASLELLAYLGPRLATMRALVLASFRPDEVLPESAVAAAIAKIERASSAGRIDLVPLRGTELRRFVDGALDGIELPSETLRAVVRQAEGNPFFTEELLKDAVARADGAAGRRIPIPSTIQTALLERLRPLDNADRRVIGHAAAIGRTFPLELLASTLRTDLDHVIPSLRRARDYQLVEEVAPLVFRFRHGLTRDAIYGNFLSVEARALHRTVALTLEATTQSERPIEALAYHWWAADCGPESARYNELAGDAAGRVHAHEDAIAFYERALQTEGLPAPSVGTILEKVAERRLALTSTEEAHATYCSAADVFERAGSYEREAACRANAAILAYVTGLPEPAAALETMLARLDSSEYLARSRVHLGLAWLDATFGFPTRANGHLRAVDARLLDAEPDVGLRFHNVAAFVAMTLGDLDTFEREFPAWIAAAAASGSARPLVAAHLNVAMSYSFFGMHEPALEFIERALAIALDARSPYSEEAAYAIGALCHLLRGDLKRTREAVERVSLDTENNVNFTLASACATIAADHLGEPELGERWFDAWEARESKPEIECGAGFAEIMVRRGRPADAADFLHRVLPDCEVTRGNVPTLLAVAKHGWPKDRVRARELLAQAAQALVELPERAALALFDAIEHERGGRRAQAVACASAAAEGFRRMRMSLLEAWALEASGDPAAALELYRRCGASADVRRLTGGAAAGASASASAFSMLSKREHEIAALAVRGRSNLEIARELSISHKTVEKHLASAFRKLGIASRRELHDVSGFDRALATTGL